MNVLVCQHHDAEHAGRLASTLRDHGFRLDVRRPDRDGTGALPTDLDDIHAMVLMGGPQNVGDGLSWIDAEADLVRRAHERELPVIGICLGAQIIAHALGGSVEPMDSPEWGFGEVSLTVPGQTETIMAGMPWHQTQLHAHGQQVVELPEGATHLATSAHCTNQAFRVGLRTYAFQYHFECDRAMIHGRDVSLARAFPGALRAAGVTVEELERQAAEHYESYARLGDRLCVNLATYCFPFERLMAV